MSDYTRLTGPTLKSLIEELQIVIKWELLGLFMGIPDNELTKIRNQFFATEGIEKCKLELYKLWLNKGKNASWESVAEALDKIGNGALADYIKRKYSSVLHDPVLTPNVPAVSIVSPPEVKSAESNSTVAHITDEVDSSIPNQVGSMTKAVPDVIVKRQLVKSLEELEETFAALVVKTQKAFMEDPSLLPLLIRYVKTRFSGKGNLSGLSSNATYNDVFDVLSLHLHCLQVKPLLKIVEILPQSPLTEDVKQYESDLVKYKNSTILKDLIDIIKSKKLGQSDMKPIVMKLGRFWLDVTIANFELLIQMQFEEMEDFLYINSVTDGCVCVTFSTPTNVTSNITLKASNNYSFLRSVGIAFIMVDDQEIFKTDLENVKNITVKKAFQVSFECQSLSAIELLLSISAKQELLNALEWTDVTHKASKISNKQGMTVLYFASKYGHSEVVSALLKAGAIANVSTNDKRSPLLVASFYGHKEVVKLLLEAGADPNILNKHGATPLYFASANGHKDVVLILLQNGGNPRIARTSGWTPLMVACENGHLDVVHTLLGISEFFSGAITVNVNFQNDNGVTALYLASQNGYIDIVNVLTLADADPNLAKANGMTPLMIACNKNHQDVVFALLSCNASPNEVSKDGWTALTLASQLGHENIVSSLFQFDAKPNTARTNGATPLHLACYNGHSKVVALLLKHGANPNLTLEKESGDQYTPLMIASSKGDISVIEELLKANTHINFESNGGVTALNLAIQFGHVNVVEALISARADPRRKNKKGQSPIVIARHYKQTEIEEILKDAILKTFRDTDFDESVLDRYPSISSLGSRLSLSSLSEQLSCVSNVTSVF